MVHFKSIAPMPTDPPLPAERLTNAERQAAHRARQRQAGRVSIVVYVLPQYRGEVRELECRLRGLEQPPAAKKPATQSCG